MEPPKEIEIYKQIIHKELEPAVINEKMLHNLIREQMYKGIALTLATDADYKWENVTIIRIEFQNILRIDYMWKLPNLTKLSLNFNKIDKIENLEMLTKLKELDLSCNYIGKIENLDTLTQLEVLSLFNNRIKRLENLDALENLLILSVAKNNISELEGVERFRFMKKLFSLNLEDNPISENGLTFRLYIAALLPKLKCYNYKYILEEERTAGTEKYIYELRKIDESQLVEVKERDRIAKEIADATKFSASFVEHLDKEQLFELFFKEDENGALLLACGPDVQTIYDEYRIEVYEITQNMFNLGLDRNEQRLSEISLFKQCITHGKKVGQEFGQTIVIAIQEYVREKVQRAEEILRLVNGEDEEAEDLSEEDIGQLIQEFQIMKNEFYVKANAKWKVLMDDELQLFERIEETNTKFEHAIKDMINEFIEGEQAYFVQLRDAEGAFSDALYENVSKYISHHIGTKTFDAIPEGLHECLEDKDALANFTAGCRDNHMQKIDAREEHLISRARNWVNALVADIHANELQRHRKKVLEINYFMQNQRNIFDQLAADFDELDGGDN